MSFAEILGHDRIIDLLRRSLRAGKTAHSYIFEGIEGCGRRKTALTLIKSLFCTNMVDDECGVCSSCRKIANGNHPDLLFISPLPDKRDIAIEQIRDMQADFGLKPFEAARKVCIIEPAERLNPNSANCLLKTLEEPPGNALIILLVENSEMLLETVRSRCQILKFSPLSPENIKAILEVNGVESDIASLIAPMAAGSMQKATSLDNETVVERREFVLSKITNLSFKQISTVFDATEQLAGKREATLETVDMLISFYRDVVHLAAGNSEIINISQRSSIEALAKKNTLQRNLELLEAIHETRRAIQKNANTKIALDQLLIKMAVV